MTQAEREKLIDEFAEKLRADTASLALRLGDPEIRVGCAIVACTKGADIHHVVGNMETDAAHCGSHLMSLAVAYVADHGGDPAAVFASELEAEIGPLPTGQLN